MLKLSKMAVAGNMSLRKANEIQNNIFEVGFE